MRQPELPLGRPDPGPPRMIDDGATYEAICWLRKRGYLVTRQRRSHHLRWRRRYGRWRSVTLTTDDQLRDFARRQGWKPELSPPSTLSTA
jgi:hypothetical protein